VFVPNVQAAEDLSKKIKGSAYVHGKSSVSERNRIIDGFKDMSINVVINVEVLTTGFDHPQLDAIVLARPTASIALYYQIMGRGTRIHPEKANTKIMDLSGNVSNFGPIEYLNYEYIQGYGWGMFTRNECLTHNPIKARHKRPTKETLRYEYTQKAIENSKPYHKFKMEFGKYAGKTLDVIPKHYLSYALDNWSFHSAKMKLLKKSIEKVLQL